jgi:hypothetical protein
MKKQTEGLLIGCTHETWLAMSMKQTGRMRGG